MTTTAPLSRLLDQSELAELLNITERHVRRLVSERRIPYVKVGRFVRFEPEQVQQWILDSSRSAIR